MFVCASSAGSGLGLVRPSKTYVAMSHLCERRATCQHVSHALGMGALGAAKNTPQHSSLSPQRALLVSDACSEAHPVCACKSTVAAIPSHEHCSRLFYVDVCSVLRGAGCQYGKLTDQAHTKKLSDVMAHGCARDLQAELGRRQT